jgi:hypothetical protein
MSGLNVMGVFAEPAAMKAADCLGFVLQAS